MLNASCLTRQKSGPNPHSEIRIRSKTFIVSEMVGLRKNAGKEADKLEICTSRRYSLGSGSGAIS